MAEISPDPARPLSALPNADPSPTEPSSRADDPTLEQPLSYDAWLAALEAAWPDVIDALVDARARRDASAEWDLGERLVEGWVSPCLVGDTEEGGTFLPFDHQILEAQDENDDLLHYLEDAVPARRMKALRNGGVSWTERELALAHAKAAEDFFMQELYSSFEIVRLVSREGTPIFVAHILLGDYPCDSSFAGAADSIAAAIEEVKALGYVSADDVRERYPVTPAPRVAAVSVEPSVSPSTLWVVYKVDGKRGALFEFAEAAVKSHAIQCALNDAQTWGEFKRLLPAGEWAELEDCLAVHEDDDSRPWEDDLDGFDRDLVGEVVGSHYGMWGEDGNHWLPAAVLAEHGQRRFPSGNDWFIDGSRADAVAEALRVAGYRVERADFLLG